MQTARRRITGFTLAAAMLFLASCVPPPADTPATSGRAAENRGPSVGFACTSLPRRPRVTGHWTPNGGISTADYQLDGQWVSMPLVSPWSSNPRVFEGPVPITGCIVLSIAAYGDADPHQLIYHDWSLYWF